MSTLLAHLCLYLSLCLWLHSSHVLSTTSLKEEDPSVSSETPPTRDDDTPPLQPVPSQIRKKTIPKKLGPSEQEEGFIGSLKSKVHEREKKHDGESIKLKVHEKEKKYDDESLEVSPKLQKEEIVDPKDPKIMPYTKNHKDQRIYMYDTSFKQDDPKNNYLTTRIILLSNSMILLQYMHCLCLGSEFFKRSELAALAVTCKDAYLHLKRSLDIHKKQAMLSYKFHPAYQTCSLLDPHLRNCLAQDPKYRENMFDLMSTSFEAIYLWLLAISPKKGFVSRESFSSMFIWDDEKYGLRALYLLICKVSEKHKWSRKELETWNGIIKESLANVVQRYLKSPKYDFIPPVVDQEVNQSFYEQILKRAQSMRLPFYNCPCVLRLLISSGNTPLNLFLFWDIFNALEVEILNLDVLRAGIEASSPLKENKYIAHLIQDIIQIYSNQDKEYLSNLYFEMVGYIQHDFFENHHYYKPGQKKQNQINFGKYMRHIQAQIQTFLADDVFALSCIGIVIETP